MDMSGTTGNVRNGCEAVIGGFGLGRRNEEGEKSLTTASETSWQ